MIDIYQFPLSALNQHVLRMPHILTLQAFYSFTFPWQCIFQALELVLPLQFAPTEGIFGITFHSCSAVTVKRL